MDNTINQLIKETFGSIMGKSRDALLLKDDIYLHYNDDRESLEKHYTHLDLSDNDRAIIDSYVSCVDTLNNRIADISYIAGIVDTIKLLNSFGLLKEYE